MSFILSVAAAVPVLSFDPASKPEANEIEFFAAPSVEDERCWIVHTKRAVYSFEIPRGFDARSHPASRTVELASAAGTIRVHFDIQPSSSAIEAHEWRKELVLRYPGAVVTEISELSALQQPAVCIDLQWGQSEAPRAGRFARVAAPSGQIEFAVLSSPGNLGDYLPGLSQLMLSFRSNSPGQAVTIKQRLRE